MRLMLFVNASFLFLIIKIKAHFLTECSTPEDNLGYCIQASSCPNQNKLSECAPVQAATKKYCCELENIKFPSTLECGFQQELADRILGGEPTIPREFPWLVKIYRRNQHGHETFACTGSLISTKAVLTTAHCISAEKLEPLGDLHSVSVGDHDSKCNSCTQPERIRISKVIIHPKYSNNSKNFHHDIGVIMLKDEAPYTFNIRPICLPEENSTVGEYFISGWGKTESGLLSPIKLKLSLAPFSWKQCYEKYQLINITLINSQICAGGEENKDSCSGDSGGALMVKKNERWYVAGVVSFGVGCGIKGWPAVYTNVLSYVNWLKDELNKL